MNDVSENEWPRLQEYIEAKCIRGINNEKKKEKRTGMRFVMNWMAVSV